MSRILEVLKVRENRGSAEVAFPSGLFLHDDSTSRLSIGQVRDPEEKIFTIGPGENLPSGNWSFEENRLNQAGDRGVGWAAEHQAHAEDLELAGAIVRRDRKATADFVANYSDDIYIYVRSRLLPRMDLVDDLVQDIFLAAWENLGSYRGNAALKQWVQGIARHKVENYYRACLRAPLPLEEAEQSASLAAESDVAGMVDLQRLQEKTRRVLASLPEEYCLALLWRYWEKRSAQEMAEQTGKTVKAIERLLARAREMFRGRWKDA